jgi:uncharacterized repeat protein (TIGR03847 family)
VARIQLFAKPDRFTVGTVGQPGERTFFIQVREEGRLVSLSLEKTQVQALSERLGVMAKEIKEIDPTFVFHTLPRDEAPLDTPIEEEFRIGVIGLSFDTTVQRIQIDMQAVTENVDENVELSDDQLLSIDAEIVRVLIDPSEIARFSKRTQALLSAGRQPCPFCGGPLDPRGHLCPRANGYRR